jgi:hypothetical protein
MDPKRNLDVGMGIYVLTSSNPVRVNPFPPACGMVLSQDNSIRACASRVAENVSSVAAPGSSDASARTLSVDSAVWIAERARQEIAEWESRQPTDSPIRAEADVARVALIRECTSFALTIAQIVDKLNLIGTPRYD